MTTYKQIEQNVLLTFCYLINNSSSALDTLLFFYHFRDAK